MFWAILKRRRPRLPAHIEGAPSWHTRYVRQWLWRKLSRPVFQPVWERIFAISLRGMNVGGGDCAEVSGEREVIRGLPHGAVVFDVGANRGRYARMALDIRPDLLLYCFEPSPVACQQLRSLPVKSFLFGLGDEDLEQVAFFGDIEGSELGSLYPRHLDSFGEVESIKLRRLDSFCAEHEIDRIDLLKLDVEGHELAILRGMGDLRPKRVQFEFGGCNVDSRTYLRDFFEILGDYAIYRILPNGIRRVLYQERMELFTTTNFLAVRL